MEELKTMKQQFISAVQGELARGINKVDAHEMGEVVDMIKDLSEAIYYCSVTDAMDKSSQEDKEYYMEKYMPSKYYTPYPRYYDERNRDMEMYSGRMYFTEPKANVSVRGNYSRDMREGRSPMSRRMFMETKENGSIESSMKELEHYLKDLSEDVVEMIENLNNEERIIVKQKLSALANKIA